MNKDELKAKIQVMKWDAQNKLAHAEEKAKMFWNENRDYIVVLATVALTVGEKVIRQAKRQRNLDEEKYLKERFIYDRSRGCYYELRRKPSNKELLEIDRRKANGESLGAILNSMRILR